VAAAFAATAILVFVSAHAEGSYFATQWPLLGVVLIVVAVALLLLGAPVSLWQLAAAGALTLLGLIALASTAWGGLPDIAWKTLDQALIAAAALLVGAMATGFDRRGSRLILGGVLAGTVVLAVDMMYRLQAGSAPGSWFEGRKVDGPVGYHNAQAAFFAIGIPLALWASTRGPALARFAGGAAAATLVGALLVTQSRGAIIATFAAVVVQTAFARDGRLLAHTVFATFVGGALILPLRDLDAALVNASNAAAPQFRSFSGYTLVGAAALGLICSLPLVRTVRLVTLGAAAVAIVGAGVAAVPHLGDVRPDIHRALHGEEPTNLPAGETRLSSLSLTGRTQIWRVALDTYRSAPVLGQGSGRFTEHFTRARTNHNLYVLEPHSIELEFLSELGLPGIAAFAGFVLLAGIGLAKRGGPRAPRAAGAAVLVALLAQASIDWTFSFPALVAASLLAVGAAMGRGTLRASRPLPILGGVVVSLAVAVALAGPYLAERDLRRARAASTPADRAWQLLRDARAYNPWSPGVVDYQGELAEDDGRFRQAADLYGKAEKLSRLSWVEEYRRARALRSGHLVADAKVACKRAQELNPLEQLLERGPCDFG
jgi:O-Antigen ligase